MKTKLSMLFGLLVIASMVLAPRFDRLPGRTLATLGFGVATLAFGLLVRVSDYATMAALHALAGVAAGSALSMTHGTIARSANPHRLFAGVGMALGLFAVVFLGGASRLVMSQGGPTLFMLFAAVMAVATVTAAAAFPDARLSRDGADAPRPAFPACLGS